MDSTIFDTLKAKKFRDLLTENFDVNAQTWSTLQTLVTDITTNNVLGLNILLLALNKEWYDSTYEQKHLNGIICLRPREVLNYIEKSTGYTINLSTSIATNANFLSGNIPFFDLIPFNTWANQEYSLYLKDDAAIRAIYSPLTPENITDNFDYYGQKTVFDFLKMLSTMFCAIIEFDDLAKTITLTGFNDILTSTTVKDWSKKMIDFKKSSSFGAYGVKNYIDYKLDDGVSVGSGRVIFDCGNLNLEPIKQFNIDCIIPRTIFYNGAIFHYTIGGTDKTQTQFTDKPLKEFIYLLDSYNTTNPILLFADYENYLG